MTELADQGKIDELNENSAIPKIVIDQTPSSSANSDDSGLGGESNATMDGKHGAATQTSYRLLSLVIWCRYLDDQW